MHLLEDDRIELFDLSVDPFEQHNLTEELPEIVRTMDRQLNDWKKEVGASEFKEKNRDEKKGKPQKENSGQ